VLAHLEQEKAPLGYTNSGAHHQPSHTQGDTRQAGPRQGRPWQAAPKQPGAAHAHGRDTEQRAQARACSGQRERRAEQRAGPSTKGKGGPHALTPGGKAGWSLSAGAAAEAARLTAGTALPPTPRKAVGG
jgi:hypothetical protein